jgi:hypothetical protein
MKRIVFGALKGPGYEIRERQWREAFGRNDRSWFCFVVERPDGQLVGFAQGNRSGHPDFAGELNKIDLLREYQWLSGDARNPSSRV